MTVSFKQATTFSLVAILGLVSTSCGESKAAQCNRLIEVANSAVESVQEVISTSAQEDPNAMLEIAATADQATGSMQELDLQDETLQSYQQRFITMYTETSAATRSLVEAVNAKNSTGAEQAYNQLQAATGQENTLVTEVNEYCSQ